MSSDIKFSVVIPVFNRAHLIPALLRSLSEQTHRNFEIVVVDDGSSDAPETQLDETYGLTVRLIRQENAGGGAARNLGIDSATGEWIAFLDSDDFFLPQKLARVAECIVEQGGSIIYSYARVDRGNNIYGRKPARGIRSNESFEDYALIARQPTQTSTLVIKRDLAAKVRFNQTLRKFQDIDFCLRLARTGAQIRFIPEELTIWTDKVPEGRVGNVRRPDAAYEMLALHQSHLSRQAIAGYKANLLSYEIGLLHPFRAAGHVVSGFFVGGVSIKRSIQSLFRAILPQEIYRPLLDRFLAFFR